ncbi:zinc-ribbon domain-containing protein [uncultured Prevotella sp.]|uniref:zinc-ribbon domain-containing protein n=1 Tax=uncultured Prevotella sp. TaxID=159272 RepID=UPI00266ED803|nr:zinc-ribbon domain-containing protein [uncultured Prevotella sp.]
MKCKSCLKEIPDDSTFCPNCGKPINNINRNYKKIQLKNLSLKGILVIIAIGIWMLVLQNLGIIPVTQDVRVKNTIDADVSGRVYVDGGTISVE